MLFAERSMRSQQLVLTGSFASAFHGAPRTTQDVDIVIAPTLGSLQKLVTQFPEKEYYVSREAALQAYGFESLFNVIDLNSGWKIDFHHSEVASVQSRGIRTAARS